jgi:hypothetical protein
MNDHPDEFVKYILTVAAILAIVMLTVYFNL